MVYVKSPILGRAGQAFVPVLGKAFLYQFEGFARSLVDRQASEWGSVFFGGRYHASVAGADSYARTLGTSFMFLIVAAVVSVSAACKSTKNETKLHTPQVAPWQSMLRTRNTD